MELLNAAGMVDESCLQSLLLFVLAGRLVWFYARAAAMF